MNPVQFSPVQRPQQTRFGITLGDLPFVKINGKKVPPGADPQLGWNTIKDRNLNDRIDDYTLRMLGDAPDKFVPMYARVETWK